METQESLSSVGLKQFVKHLILTTKKAEERKIARKNLKQQFLRAKESAANKKAPPWLIEKQFRELEKKMETALEKESRLIRIHQEESEFITEMRRKIEALESELGASRQSRQQIGELKGTMGELRDKIDQLLSHQVVRRQRIDELEHKIRKKAEKSSLIAAMETKLDELEQQHAALKRKKHSASDLRRLDEKIKNLKNVLEAKKA